MMGGVILVDTTQARLIEEVNSGYTGDHEQAVRYMIKMYTLEKREMSHRKCTCTLASGFSPATSNTHSSHLMHLQRQQEPLSLQAPSIHLPHSNTDT